MGVLFQPSSDSDDEHREDRAHGQKWTRIFSQDLVELGHHHVHDVREEDMASDPN